MHWFLVEMGFLIPLFLILSVFFFSQIVTLEKTCLKLTNTFTYNMNPVNVVCSNTNRPILDFDVKES